MGMKFTPEQQRVIELHNSNILVSAAAGSGKTAVLVERIIRMICDGEHPADIDRLLIVTFTNAAAAEMRERIAAGIAARLEADPGNEHIQKQSALLHNAQITTIDQRNPRRRGRIFRAGFYSCALHQGGRRISKCPGRGHWRGYHGNPECAGGQCLGCLRHHD